MKLLRYSNGDIFGLTNVPGKDRFTMVENFDSTVIESDGEILRIELKERDVVYGLGQQVRSMNKRGWIYTSFNADDFDHTEGKSSLYGSHNFFVIDSDKKIGIFVDSPGEVTFDVGYTDDSVLTIDSANGYDLYYIEGDSVLEVSRFFRSVIAKPYMPPKWALGIMQSRWGYQDAKDIDELVERYKESGIPLDMICLDIDYMEKFKNFTVDKEKFEDIKGLSESLKAQEGIRLIPIIDAGCKVEDGYQVHEEGIAGGFYVKDEAGEPFTASVWPGHVHFPDFLNSKAKNWFGDLYKYLVDIGIEGVWNDMNEPAIFYSTKGLKEAFDKIETYKGRNLDTHEFFQFKSVVNNLSNSMEDYKSMYHDVDGVKVRHDLVHNVFGSGMTEATYNGFLRHNPGKRPLVFSRASHIGGHQYGGIWTGDNKAWWGHLKLIMSMLPSLNMAGFLYTGSDIGGFGDNCTGDLLLNWYKVSILTPLFRNHSALGTRHQEPYQFGARYTEKIRSVISVRKSLESMVYSELLKANMNDTLMFMPLGFKYDDQISKEVSDQLLFSTGIMLAPIVNQNEKTRTVYVPEKMALLRADENGAAVDGIYEKGDHRISCADNQVNFLVPQGGYMFFEKDGNVQLYAYPSGSMTCEILSDEGIELFDPQKVQSLKVNISEDGTYTIDGQIEGFSVKVNLIG